MTTAATVPEIVSDGPDPNNVMRLGTDIRYAMNFPGEAGGRRIVIITPRVIGFRETANQPRTADYPFTLFEMRFDKSGRGEGRMAYATQLTFDKANNAIELENYSSEPVRLNNFVLEVRKSGADSRKWPAFRLTVPAWHPMTGIRRDFTRGHG